MIFYGPNQCNSCGFLTVVTESWMAIKKKQNEKGGQTSCLMDRGLFSDLYNNWCHQTVTIRCRCWYSTHGAFPNTAALPQAWQEVRGNKLHQPVPCPSTLVWRSEFSVAPQLEGLNLFDFPHQQHQSPRYFLPFEMVIFYLEKEMTCQGFCPAV